MYPTSILDTIYIYGIINKLYRPTSADDLLKKFPPDDNSVHEEARLALIN